jgi:TonB family protein
MKNIVRILLAVALLIAVPTTMNAQKPKGKTTKGKVTTKAKTTTTNNRIDELKKDAQKGDVLSQSLLGDSYYYGKEVTQDYKQAVYWYKKAAEQGDVKARCQLGFCYFKGEGVTQDYQQAIYWFKNSAAPKDRLVLGYPLAQLALGFCYYNGEGVAKDDEQAVFWWYKAAIQGDEEALSLLGWCYDAGIGVDRDLEEAAYCFKKAAEKGHLKAQKAIGECYYNGKGVDKDLKQSAYWFKKAAEQGDEDSKELLEEVEEEIQSLSASSSGQVYDIAEQMPSFPGGQSALFQYLSKNIQYPKLCEEHGIQGRVICSYIVEEDGSITDVQVRKSVHPSLDKEAVRVIQSMPKWNPGKENGLPVRVRYNLPITFSLK